MGESYHLAGEVWWCHGSPASRLVLAGAQAWAKSSSARQESEPDLISAIFFIFLRWKPQKKMSQLVFKRGMN